MSEVKSMSVIIYDGCFRERHHLVECLSTQNVYPDDFEIFWTDYYDGDHDLPESPYLTRIDLGYDKSNPIFVSRCHNAGIAASAGELLMHIDGDVWVDNDFLGGARRACQV